MCCIKFCEKHGMQVEDDDVARQISDTVGQCNQTLSQTVCMHSTLEKVHIFEMLLL